MSPLPVATAFFMPSPLDLARDWKTKVFIHEEKSCREETVSPPAAIFINAMFCDRTYCDIAKLEAPPPPGRLGGGFSDHLPCPIAFVHPIPMHRCSYATVLQCSRKNTLSIIVIILNTSAYRRLPDQCGMTDAERNASIKKSETGRVESIRSYGNAKGTLWTFRNVYRRVNS